MTVREHTADPALCARDISPMTAIEAGYNLYLAQYCDPHSPLGESARKAVSHFEALLELFEQHSPQGVYCLQLRLAANSLARGIERRKKTLQSALDAIEAEKDDVIKRLAQTEGWWGILRGGAQILALGGFGYALVRALFSLPTLTEGTAGMNEGFAALATGLGTALIGSFLKAKYMARHLLKVFKQYSDAIRDAHAQYAASVQGEYRLAAETAHIAWTALTGEKPPTSSEFHLMLMRNISTADGQLKP